MQRLSNIDTVFLLAIVVINTGNRRIKIKQKWSANRRGNWNKFVCE